MSVATGILKTIRDIRARLDTLEQMVGTLAAKANDRVENPSIREWLRIKGYRLTASNRDLLRSADRWMRSGYNCGEVVNVLGLNHESKENMCTMVVRYVTDQQQRGAYRNA